MQFFGFCTTCHDQVMFFKKTVKIFVFHTLFSNHFYLLLREFTQIHVLPIGNKYWQLCGSGLNAWLKSSWKPSTGGLKIVYQKKLASNLSNLNQEIRKYQRALYHIYWRNPSWKTSFFVHNLNISTKVSYFKNDLTKTLSLPWHGSSVIFVPFTLAVVTCP